MSLLRVLGLRARLAVALSAVAVAAIAVATLLSNRGLEGSLTDFARERLDASAEHTAALAASVYRREGGWNERVVEDLGHVARADELALTIRDSAGRRMVASRGRGAEAPTEHARAPVLVGGTRVGTVSVAPLRGGLLTGEERNLRSSLDRLHLLAALFGVAIALGAAVLVASSLARPIRRLTDAARRIERGELSARFPTGGGGQEIEQLGHALERLSRTLEREEDLRRDTVADISHELRTPVSGILTRIEAAQDGVLVDERANLAAMHTEALRLSRLIRDMGRLAEAERPGLLVAKVPLDLAQVARRRADAYAELFEGKGLRFRYELTPAPVRGDAGRLDQVVENLLSNALRYTDEGGEVELTTRLDGDEAVLEVSDTGIGIAPEDLAHVFTRFWRGERSRSRATGGAGIGLAVVRELVRAHDGRVDVESAPGRGSRLRVTLPADRRGAG